MAHKHLARGIDSLLVGRQHLAVAFPGEGDVEATWTYLEQVLDRLPPSEMLSTAGGDFLVYSLSYSHNILWLLGYPELALQICERTLARARQLGHPYSMVLALSFAAVLHYLLRDIPRVRQLAEEAVNLASDRGFAQWKAHGTLLKGWAVAQQGQTIEGLAVMRQGWEDWQATGARLSQTYYFALMAEIYRQNGQAGEGLSVLAGALQAVDEMGERWWEAEIHRLKGELLLLQGDATTEAGVCFSRAIDVARRQGARSLELRAATSMGRLWHKQGKAVEARRLLEETCAWFTEGLRTPELLEAEALLADISSN